MSIDNFFTDTRIPRVQSLPEAIDSTSLRRLARPIHIPMRQGFKIIATSMTIGEAFDPKLADGWRAMKRLGVQTFRCSHCAVTSPLDLPPGGGNVYSRHWRVEVRTRSAGVSSWPGRSWIACSQDCARAYAKVLEVEHGRPTRGVPKVRCSVHGPCIIETP